MKSRLIFILMAAVIAAGFMAAPQAGAAEVDRIVATVNGDVITMKQLDKRVRAMASAKNQLTQADFRRKVLNALIEQELVNQYARKKGILVTDREAEEAINQIKAKHKLTDAQFKAALAHQGTTPQLFKEDIKAELTKNKTMGALIAKKIVVTDREVIDYLNGKGPKKTVGSFDFSGQSEVGAASGHLPRLLFLAVNGGKSSKAMAKANKIKQEIDGGLSFADAARKYSEGPGKDAGGDLGPGTTVSSLHPKLKEVAQKMSPGEVSQPIDLKDAVVLMTLVEGAAPAPVKGSKGNGGKGSSDFSEDTKKAAKAELEQIKMRDKYINWIEEIKRTSNIKITL